MNRFLWIILIILCGFSAQAQIAMKIMTNQDYYLQYESIYVRVMLRNQSGHALTFGENKGLRGVLEFDIEGIDSGRFAMQRSLDTPTMKGIILKPGTTRVFTFNVSNYYDIRQTGKYIIKARISHPQLAKVYESNKVLFSVVNGQTIWKTAAGLPQYMQKMTNSRIPIRRYRIVSYDLGKNRVYALIIEDDERVYLLRRIGIDLGGSLRPQCAVDENSILHLVVAASPKVFAYYRYNLSGKLEHKEVRIKSDTIPHLSSNPTTGTVIFTGGRAARPDLDYEEIKTLPYISRALEENIKDITQGKSIFDERDD